MNELKAAAKMLAVLMRVEPEERTDVLAIVCDAYIREREFQKRPKVTKEN